MKANGAEPTAGPLGAVPLELHGHRKKLGFFIRSLEAFRLDRGRAPADVTILEVGCSNGRNVAMPLARAGFRVTGVDLHEPSIRYAAAHNDLPNARFLCQDFYGFASDEGFDVIVLSDVLEHVDDPGGLLRVALEHLEPDGMVLVCVPNGYGPYELEQRVLRRTGLNRAAAALHRFGRRVFRRPTAQATAYNSDCGHVQFFRMEDMEALAARNDLRIVERGNGALFGGDLTFPLGVVLPFLVPVSLSLADRIPSRWVSTWYFRMEPDRSHKLAGG